MENQANTIARKEAYSVVGRDLSPFKISPPPTLASGNRNLHCRDNGGCLRKQAQQRRLWVVGCSIMIRLLRREISRGDCVKDSG